jgi:glucose-6-phosphate 1-dehydrogenase
MKEKHPIIFTIFGATGDLAQRKIIPALMDLYCRDLLPENFNVVGFSRKDLSDENYREFAKNSIDGKDEDYSESKVKEFLTKISYKQGDLTNIDSYDSLSKYLKSKDEELSDCSNKLFYLAVPPSLYNSSFENLSKSGLGTPCFVEGEKRWARILVEKPFGSDKDEAKKLDKTLGKLFDEDQIFRIDHYLAKETIQNILAFRFANAIFEPIWNNKYIEKVELKLYETVDADDRASFYDGIGALRDVGQNHLLQMLALVAMEDPMSLDSKMVKKSRGDVFSNISVNKKDLPEFSRGQYEGYTNNDDIDSKSKTETYFKIKLGVKNKRWSGVPFYLESGKALNEKRTEIKITFKDKESSVCPIDGICKYNNVLTINTEPDKKISICFWSKKPGLDMNLEEKKLSFDFDENPLNVTDAYEKVLYDCIKGDQTLFASTYEISTQWGIISNIFKLWKNIPLLEYKKGSAVNDLSNKK